MPIFDEILSDFLAHLHGLGRARNTLDAYRRDLAGFLLPPPGKVRHRWPISPPPTPPPGWLHWPIKA